MAEEMMIIHNVLLRLVKSIWLRTVGAGAHSAPEHIPNFFHYTKGAIYVIHMHYRGEENDIIPVRRGRRRWRGLLGLGYSSIGCLGGGEGV